MALSPQHPTNPPFTLHASRFTLNTILLALFCFIYTACGTTGQTGKILFDDPRGTVSLQTISDPSIQANHPINLESALLAQLLTGIQIHDEGLGEHHVKGFQTLIEGKAALTYPLFSEDQIQFLAPLIAEGLRKATPNESVEYRVVTTYEPSNRFQSPTTETTTGSLYAYGRQLYVILTQYRYNPTLTNLSFAEASHRSQDPLDYSGLKHRTLLFTPKAALRADSPDLPTMDKQTDRFLAIDYQLLQQTPPAAATTGQTAPQMGTSPMSGTPVGTSPSEAQTHKTEALAQEVETLRKELQSVQQQLGNQPAKQDRPKKKTTPAAKKP